MEEGKGKWERVREVGGVVGGGAKVCGGDEGGLGCAIVSKIERDDASA